MSRLFKPSQRPRRNYYFRLSPAEEAAARKREQQRHARHRAQIAADIQAAKAKATRHSANNPVCSASLPVLRCAACGAPATGMMNDGSPRCCATCAFDPRGCRCQYGEPPDTVNDFHYSPEDHDSYA